MKKKTHFLLIIIMVFTINNRIFANDNVLNIFNWSEYLPQKVLDIFTAETGIKVNYTSFESNEEMYSRVALTGGVGYDIIVPSSYFVTLMARQGLLRKIDVDRLDNYKNIDRALLTKNAEYAIPYCWGSTVMLVNSKYINPHSMTSWNDLFKPELIGKIFLLDDLRDVFAISLHALGFSINTEEEDEIAEASQWLTKLKPAVKVFNSEDVIELFMSEEVVAGIVYNGDAINLNSNKPELTPIFPKEGIALWVDSFSIPTKAKNIENAYKFIDFMLRPEINKIVTEELNYSTPNIKTFELLDNELKENRVFNPTDSELINSEFTDDVGSSIALYEKYWYQLRSE